MVKRTVARDTAYRKREGKAEQHLNEIMSILHKAKGLPELDVVFCAALPRCQAPNSRGLQCRMVGKYRRKFAHHIRGKRVFIEHVTCHWHY